jgi:hypothetical protein
MVRHHHSLLREATDVWLIGAGTVIGWFLLSDSIAQRPLYTPAALGQIVFFGHRTPEFGWLDWAAIGGYAFLHFILFAVVAVTVVWALHRAIRQPTWLVGLLLLVVSGEVFFLGATYALLSRTGGEPLWESVVIANLLAALAIGFYLWRTHRLISRWLARVPLGDTGDEPEVNTPAAWHAMAKWRGR